MRSERIAGTSAAVVVTCIESFTVSSTRCPVAWGASNCGSESMLRWQPQLHSIRQLAMSPLITATDSLLMAWCAGIDSDMVDLCALFSSGQTAAVAERGRLVINSREAIIVDAISRRMGIKCCFPDTFIARVGIC